MNLKNAFLLLATACSTALADTVILPASKDNTLYENATGDLSNGKGASFFVGTTLEETNSRRRGLIAFDLSSIPAGAMVTAASLSMSVTRAGPDPVPGDISLNRVLADWGEGLSDAGSPGGQGAPAETGDATWIHTFYNTSFWANSGGDFSSTASATTAVTTVGIYSWSSSQLVADVQSWVSNPAGNFGWIVTGDEINPGSAARFSSRENSTDPPQLSVTFQLSSSPTPTPTPGPSITPTPSVTPTATPTPTPATPQALNIATRLRVETGNNVLIAGFIISGNATKNIVAHGIGPSLAAFGITDPLADPTLELHASNGSLLFDNDNWQDNPGQAAQLINLGLAPGDPKESGIAITLQPAAYTAIVAGKNQGTGVGIVEIYDTSGGTSSQLANISTRGFVRTGENVMIGGFILGGSSANSRVALRGIGPSLAQFGLSPVLDDPILELHDSNGTTLITNDDWQSDPASAAALTATGFVLSDAKESGIFTSLPAGAFTAILAGKNGGIGIGLVELFNLH